MSLGDNYDRLYAVLEKDVPASNLCPQDDQGRQAEWDVKHLPSVEMASNDRDFRANWNWLEVHR